MEERTKIQRPLNRQLLRTSGIYSSLHQQVHPEVLLQIIWVARQRHSGRLHASRCRKFQSHISCGLRSFRVMSFQSVVPVFSIVPTFTTDDQPPDFLFFFGQEEKLHKTLTLASQLLQNHTQSLSFAIYYAGRGILY